MAASPILGDLIQLRINVVFVALSQFGEDVAVAIYPFARNREVGCVGCHRRGKNSANS